MFEVKDSICVAGAKCNEDAIGFGKHYLFAIDGASGLTGVNFMGPSDAAWFSHEIQDGLSKVLDNGDSRPTAEILKELISCLSESYHKRALELLYTPPKDSPSAGIAMFREWPDGSIELFALGDCTAAAQTVKGETIWSCDTMLPALDDQVLAQMAKIHQTKGISVIDAKKECNHLLIHNRNLRNTPQGYWILDLSGVGIDHARTRVWKPGELRTISVFSDGFAQLCTPFGLYLDYGVLHDVMEKTSLLQLTETLHKAQELDPEANRYPRFKFRDDISAVFAGVEKG